MAKYIDAGLIRQEIESRMGDCDANSKNPYQFLWAELAALLPFIDSRQQEQLNCHTVEDWIQHIQNADQLTKDIFSKGPYDVLYDALNYPYQHCYDAIKEFGELCFQTGVNSVKQEQPCDTCTNDKGCVTCKDGELWEGKEQPSEDLEEAAKKYSRNVSDGHNYRDLTCGFIAGAEWQAERLLKGSPMPEDTVIFQKGIEEGKRLMMEEAVEGYVNYYEDSGGILMAEAQVGCPYHNGDKVKIIIIKEDGK